MSHTATHPDDRLAQLRQAADPHTDPPTVAIATADALAAAWACTRADVELMALDAGILPRRYWRNLSTFGLSGQARLLRSRLLVVGAGGLGGYVLDGLARAGVGYLRVVDNDCFVEHNLNRQLLSSETSVGRAKAQVAAERLAQVNAAVTVEPLVQCLTEETAPAMLEGMDLAVDCLDDIPSRLALGEAARAAGIALVHGAVAGLYGQVVVIRPDGPGLEVVYPSGSSAQGVEAELGTPNSTPMLVAALQVQEAIKLLAGVGEVLTGLLRVDGYTGAFQVEPLAAETPHA